MRSKITRHLPIDLTIFFEKMYSGGSIYEFKVCI